MRFVNAQPKHTTPFWVTSRPRRGDWRMTVIVKAAYRLVSNALAVADEEEPPVAGGDDPAEPGMALRYASDFAPFKPRADFLVVGAAHAPGGKPVGSCRVSIAIGEHRKSLAVFGDRSWTMGPLGAHPGEPTPFVAMPLGYERAFGGPNYRRNPVGCGVDVRSGHPLPNIERLDQLITQSLDRPDPAGFGPLATTWQSRINKAGTYDATWQKTRWPWFPADFDWAFFNAAPADQQFSFFRGDEVLTFENLHPEHRLYRSRLPGVVARIFVARTAEGAEESFEEVAARLDTVWVDVTAERLVLVWRGVTRVSSPRLREVTAICATTEPLDTPAEIGAHHTQFTALREEAARARDAELATQRAEIDRARQTVEARVIEARALAASLRQTADGMLKALGVDVAARRARLAQQDPMAALEHAIAELKEADSAKGAQLEQRLGEMDQRVGEAMGRVGVATGTTIGQPPWNPERVAEALAAGESLAKARLGGLDLSETNFTGADLQDAILTGATLRNARFERANLAGADLGKCELSGADFTDADLSRTNLCEANIQDARFTGAYLDGAVFAKLDLTGADFTDAAGTAADFTEAVLDGACFANASLPRCRFSGARAASADFTEAILAAADFAGVKAPGIVMEGADLTNLRASRGADFTEGRFARAHAPRSVWQQAVLDCADFSRAVLTQAQFPEGLLAAAIFDRAHLQNANFEDAVLAGARLTNANLLHASFERAEMTKACVDGSNLYGAGLLDAALDEATFRGSFVAQTLLSK
jgi:uncharacterized protein YjbI with pentapeptide repeats